MWSDNFRDTDLEKAFSGVQGIWLCVFFFTILESSEVLFSGVYEDFTTAIHVDDPLTSRGRHCDAFLRLSETVVACPRTRCCWSDASTGDWDTAKWKQQQNNTSRMHLHATNCKMFLFLKLDELFQFQIPRRPFEGSRS